MWACAGYAFIEFEDAEVAEVVAETMSTCLLYGRILVSRVVPHEELHPQAFKGANKKFKGAGEEVGEGATQRRQGM